MTKKTKTLYAGFPKSNLIHLDFTDVSTYEMYSDKIVDSNCTVKNGLYSILPKQATSTSLRAFDIYRLGEQFTFNCVFTPNSSNPDYQDLFTISTYSNKRVFLAEVTRDGNGLVLIGCTREGSWGDWRVTTTIKPNEVNVLCLQYNFGEISIYFNGKKVPIDNKLCNINWANIFYTPCKFVVGGSTETSGTDDRNYFCCNNTYIHYVGVDLGITNTYKNVNSNILNAPNYLNITSSAEFTQAVSANIPTLYSTSNSLPINGYYKNTSGEFPLKSCPSVRIKTRANLNSWTSGDVIKIRGLYNEVISTTPTLTFLNKGTATSVQGTWTGIGTTEATFTFGSNSDLTIQGLDITYNFILPKRANFTFYEVPTRIIKVSDGNRIFYPIGTENFGGTIFDKLVSYGYDNHILIHKETGTIIRKKPCNDPLVIEAEFRDIKEISTGSNFKTLTPINAIATTQSLSKFGNKYVKLFNIIPPSFLTQLGGEPLSINGLTDTSFLLRPSNFRNYSYKGSFSNALDYGEVCRDRIPVLAVSRYFLTLNEDTRELVLAVNTKLPRNTNHAISSALDSDNCTKNIKTNIFIK